MTEGFGHSLKVQMRVIGALMRREMLTRYGRNNIGFLWLFAEPILFTLLTMAIWGVRKSGSGLPMTAFAITGYPVAMIWRNSVSRGMKAISSNNALLYHRNVRVLDIFTSRIMLEVIGVIAAMFFLIVAFVYLGWMQPPENTPQVVVGLGLLGWFGFALALVIGSLAEFSEVINRLWSPFSFFLFISSGIFTLVDWLPPLAQHYILLLPMAHGTELVRDGYFGSLFNAHYDIGYLVLWCLVLTLAGFVLMRRAAEQVDLS
ncbi:MAG: ABC transporter permease [Chlorobium phaeovibrioides]|nr:ABC transporter permease [Chlorobium phaeovibrioides]